jgi:hypothetical protein
MGAPRAPGTVSAGGRRGFAVPGPGPSLVLDLLLDPGVATCDLRQHSDPVLNR